MQARAQVGIARRGHLCDRRRRLCNSLRCVCAAHAGAVAGAVAAAAAFGSEDDHPIGSAARAALPSAHARKQARAAHVCESALIKRANAYKKLAVFRTQTIGRQRRWDSPHA